MVRMVQRLTLRNFKNWKKRLEVFKVMRPMEGPKNYAKTVKLHLAPAEWNVNWSLTKVAWPILISSKAYFSLADNIRFRHH